MSKQLVIIGTGGGAHDVLDIVEAVNKVSHQWDVIGFLDDVRTPSTWHLGLQVLGPIHDALRFEEARFVNTIGSEKSFRGLPGILAASGLPRERFASLIHPRFAVSSLAKLGRGVVVNFGVSVGGNAQIGDLVTLGPGSIIGHDVTIGDHSIIAPGSIISGHVRIGPSCYLGAGCTVKQHVEIAEGSLVGMGAVVVHSVAPCTTVFGNPARTYTRQSSLSSPTAPNSTPWQLVSN